MVPAIAHKGVYRYRCCVRGKEAHSSLRRSRSSDRDGRARGRQVRDMAEGFERDEPATTASTCRSPPPAWASSTAASPTTWCRATPSSATSSATCPPPMRSDAGTGGAYAARWSRRCRGGAGRGLPLRDDLRDPQLPRVRPTTRDPAGPRLAGEQRTTLVAFGTEAGLFKTPASAPWCAARAASTRRTSPTNT